MGHTSLKRLHFYHNVVIVKIVLVIVISQCSHCCIEDGRGSQRPEQSKRMKIIKECRLSELNQEVVKDCFVSFTLSLLFHCPQTPAALQIL